MGDTSSAPLGDTSGVLRPGDPALRDWLALQRALGFQPQRARRVLEPGRDPRVALRRHGCRPAPARELAALEDAMRASGALAVPFGAAAYPPRVAELTDAPPLLLVRGEPSALTAPAVAVVGARAASAYGSACARDFGAALARAGLVLVSGLALGIDAAAHAAALDAGGRSVAVLGCGPERVYPARHLRLASRIVRAGALVTEFAPGTPPRAAHFPLRNRLISALCRAVLVVEARERSGSLVTAAHAADQGVDVFAVPGPIDAPTSAGTNRLIYDGATPALDPAGFVEALAFRGVPVEPAPPAAAGRARAPRGGPERTRIVAALRHEPLTRDALAQRLGCAPEQLALDLLELELDGGVVEDRDGRLRAGSGPEA